MLVRIRGALWLDDAGDMGESKRKSQYLEQRSGGD